MDYTPTTPSYYCTTIDTNLCIENDLNQPSYPGGLCLHENKEFYSKEDILASGIAGYCIDCGSPFSTTSKKEPLGEPIDTRNESGVRCGDQCSVRVEDTKKSKKRREETEIHVIERCTHPSITEGINGIVICSHCFIEIEEKISFEPEWNSYTASSRSSKDPSRCYRQKVSTPKGIKGFFDAHNIKIDKATISRIERKYATIISNNDNKAQCRGGIIAACLFKDFRNSGNTRTTDYVRNICGISRKEMSKGLLKYYACFTEESHDYIQPEDLLPWLMSIIGIDPKHHPTLLELTRSLVNINPVLKRATPQSVASSIIYFFLCINPAYKKSLGINKTIFAKKSELSDVTITRLVTLISENIGCKVDL